MRNVAWFSFFFFFNRKSRLTTEEEAKGSLIAASLKDFKENRVRHFVIVANHVTGSNSQKLQLARFSTEL